MTHPRKPQSRSLWYFVPLALGLHGVILMLPIDRNKPAEKPRSAAIKTVPLLKSSSLVTLPKPSPTNIPVAASFSKPSSSIPAAQTTPAAQRSPAPQTLKPRPKPTPVPSAIKPTPTPSPNIFQLRGAIACDGIEDCYTSAETNGREVSEALEQQLQAQGYVLEALELNDDIGMKVYRLSQNNQPRGYLHLIWTEQGTRSLRLPNRVTDRQALAAIAEFPI